MVLEGIALDSAVESLWVVPSARLTAKVKEHVMIAMTLVQETSDFKTGVSVDVLDACSWKAVHNDSRSEVGEVEVKGILDKSSFLSGHGMATWPQQEIARQAAADTAAHLQR